MKGYDCLVVLMAIILVSSFGMVIPNTGYNLNPMPSSGNSQDFHIMSGTQAQVSDYVIEPLTFSTLIGGLREDYSNDVADSDGDGMNDGDEVAAGRDPLVPRSAGPFIQEYMVYVVLIPLIAFTVIVIILQARIEPFIEQQQNRNLRGGNALQGEDE